MRPQIVLFGDSITEQSFRSGGWGASLADNYSRKVPTHPHHHPLLLSFLNILTKNHKYFLFLTFGRLIQCFVDMADTPLVGPCSFCITFSIWYCLFRTLSSFYACIMSHLFSPFFIVRNLQFLLLQSVSRSGYVFFVDGHACSYAISGKCVMGVSI